MWSSCSWAGLHSSLVLIGQDQGAFLLAVALHAALLLVLQLQYELFHFHVTGGGGPAFLLLLRPLLRLLLRPLYRQGHYIIEEGEEAIDPIRALLS